MSSHNYQMQKLRAMLNGVELLDTPNERKANCENHGEYIQKSWINGYWEGCHKCAEERDARIKADDERMALEAKKQRWQQKIESSCIPSRFENRTLSTYLVNPENLKQKRIYEFCLDYAENFAEVEKTGRSFLMIGSVGTGKTHLSIGIALHIMQNGNSAVFTSASKMLREIKDTYRRDSDYSESEVIKRYTSCDLLIIDEVGVQRGSDYEKDTLFDVINERYESVKPTIALSNLSIDEVKLFLGERVFDRLREGGGKAFLLDWESHRGKIHE